MNAINLASEVSQTSSLIAERPLLQISEGALNSSEESAAWVELSARVVSDPDSAPQACVAAALRLCQAGTAGLSVLRFDSAGRAVFHWTAVSGLLAAQEGAATPRDASACGLCLDAGATIVVARPERMFAYLNDVRPPIVENLIVPVYGAAKTPLGTLWIAQHDSISRFGTNDARVLERLALLLAPALQSLSTTGRRRSAMLLPDSYREAEQTITRELLEERRRRERAEASEHEIRHLSDVEIQDAHHRTKNTLQMAANLLRLQSHATPSVQVRTALDESYLRLNLLARVHDLLCKSPEDSGEIFMPKLLRTLADALRNGFPEMTPRVTLEVTADPILLAVGEAIALGMFVNEVLTNAYKHAFPADATGKITLSLRSRSGHSWILQITDNGIGLSPNSRHDGLGSTLIRAFAAQLHGTLVIDVPVDSSGTAITLAVAATACEQVDEVTALS